MNRTYLNFLVNAGKLASASLLVLFTQNALHCCPLPGSREGLDTCSFRRTTVSVSEFNYKFIHSQQTRFPKQTNYGLTKTGLVTGGDLLQIRQRPLTKKGFIVINTTHLNSVSWCHVTGWLGICVHKKFHMEPNKMTRTCTLKWKIALWHLWHELKYPQMPLPSDLHAQNT